MSNNPLFLKSFDSQGPINRNCIVAMGSADYGVVAAAAATDKIIGATVEFDTVTGERVDVCMAGIVDIKLGGTVTRGALITSDANGNGVAAAPGAGSNVRIFGQAIISGVSGDIIPVLIALGSMQG